MVPTHPPAESLTAYLPIDRYHALVRGQELPDRADGAVLFADISGFTALAEALVQETGRLRGAEELTRQLNLVYQSLIDAVHTYQGSVIGFSGDAITCWFGQELLIAQQPVFDGRSGTRALTAAAAMQATRIPRAIKATEGGLSDQQVLFYVILAGILIAIFVATRLKYSRLGRNWMAVREDEDVAQAMGIDLVKTKLAAFATGAAFSALSGAIFASKLTSIYPHSFNLLVSINVLAVIIVGGLGSIPGVIVGALVLVGLPELLREFAEYRLLVYGAVLVFMMLKRPEGLVPEARRKLELHETEGSLAE